MAMTKYNRYTYTIDFSFPSGNSTQVMEEEVAKVIVQLLADENHRFMRPHAGGIAMKHNNVSRASTLS